MSNVRMVNTGNNIEINREELLMRAIRNIEKEYTQGGVEYRDIVRLQDGRTVRVPDNIMDEAERIVSNKYSNSRRDPNLGLETEYTRNMDEDSYDSSYEHGFTRDLTRYDSTNPDPTRFDRFNDNIMKELEGEYTGDDYMDDVHGIETNITTGGSVYAPNDNGNPHNSAGDIYHNPNHDINALESNPNYRRFREAKDRDMQTFKNTQINARINDDDEDCDCEDCIAEQNMQQNILFEEKKRIAEERARMYAEQMHYKDISDKTESKQGIIISILLIIVIALGLYIGVKAN